MDLDHYATIVQCFLRHATNMFDNVARESPAVLGPDNAY